MLKLIQLNIERSKHLDKVIPFLKKEQPDVICLQEVMKRELDLINKSLKTKSAFIPQCKFPFDESSKRLGIRGTAIFTSLPFEVLLKENYSPTDNVVDGTKEDHARGILVVKVKKQKSYTIATTHFTWTPDGEPDSRQRKDIKKLLNLLKPFKDLILTGDFNAPRKSGTGKIYQTLTKTFKDNIPKKYTSSIDQNLHRNKELKLMVDYIFSTQTYKVKKVEMVEGVSDHKAVKCEIYII